MAVPDPLIQYANINPYRARCGSKFALQTPQMQPVGIGDELACEICVRPWDPSTVEYPSALPCMESTAVAMGRTRPFPNYLFLELVSFASVYGAAVEIFEASTPQAFSMTPDFANTALGSLGAWVSVGESGGIGGARTCNGAGTGTAPIWNRLATRNPAYDAGEDSECTGDLGSLFNAPEHPRFYAGIVCTGLDTFAFFLNGEAGAGGPTVWPGYVFVMDDSYGSGAPHASGFNIRTLAFADPNQWDLTFETKLFLAGEITGVCTTNCELATMTWRLSE